MPLPDQTPKLPKLPFLAGDAALLATAWFIASQARVLSDRVLLAIVLCAVAAAVIGVIPFLADYARRQDEALDERQRGLEALAQTIATSAEQIGIAARGMHEIAELGQQNLRQAEELPQRLEEKIAELRAPPPPNRAAEKEERDREKRRLAEIEKIEQVAERLSRALSEWSKAPAARQPEENTEAAGPAPAAPAPAAEAAPVQPAPPPPAAGPPPAKARAPRRIKMEVPLPAPDDEAAEAGQSDPEEAQPISSVSADGATRLSVTAYIGIGNRLFIRGEGPGLAWDQGVPLQFVSIGKWRWETSDATSPVKFKLYKNDEIECGALGTGTLEPGRQLEVAAAF